MRKSSTIMAHDPPDPPHPPDPPQPQPLPPTDPLPPQPSPQISIVPDPFPPLLSPQTSLVSLSNPRALVVPSHPIPQLPLHQPISPNPPSFPPTIVDRRQLADRITRRVIRRGFLGSVFETQSPLLQGFHRSEIPPTHQILPSYASFINPVAISPQTPPPPPTPSWKNGKLTMRIPQQMIQSSKGSFSFTALGKFVGKRPSLEALEQWVHSTWRLSRPCFISLTEHGHFLFRFNTKEDSEALVNQSPLSMGKRKLLLHFWSPGDEEN
ncbi:hypothetical protein MRB53_030674 [Persea americana]|uniref:Uncharacterized protein n=1 Tax=Persea americana TaxID=3435 RepID=A0ACC2KLW7_PERAE|nr:hypothetical protein MRB53_030674 [Persea americana]